MALTSFPLLLTLLFFLPSKANFHKNHNLLTQSNDNLNNFTKPTEFFEVTKPIKLPNTKPCKHHLLHHDFGFTYGKPPFLANYNPPYHCPSQGFSKIVLEWKASCQGRQYDRIFGVWLGGVEILRGCTAEPRPNGVVWTVKKDITRYSSLLFMNETQVLAVYLGNLVNAVYTGVYHVDISIYFYPADERSRGFGEGVLNNLVFGDGFKADLILPISRNLPLKDGLWFEIENSTDTESKGFRIPQNVYRAVLEVYVSFHENDESWYSNYPNEYINANNLTGLPGNGPFREVVVSLDGEVVGAIWPFTVIFTGGTNPLFWRPITGIGSFDLPSYDIEITPFLGNLLDGKSHEFGFSVTNALNVWYIDANLHLWLDHESTKTEGKLLKHDGKSLVVSLVSNFVGLNGTFLTSAQRFITSNGWVKSSHGNITTRFNQHFSYNNSMEMRNEGNTQIVNQLIHFNDSVSFRNPTTSSFVHSFKSQKNFQLDMYTDNMDQGNGTTFEAANVTLGFNIRNSKKSSSAFTTTSLENLQKAHGYMVVKNNLVQSGLGSTRQVYKYDDDHKLCYLRNISSSNYTILYDKVGDKCNDRKQTHVAFGHGKWQPFPSHKASVVSRFD